MKKILVVVLLVVSCVQSTLLASELPRKAPKFPKKAIWLNLPSVEGVKSFKGRVTLIDFWSYASINSLRTLSYVKKWEDVYGPLGLQVVGVHAPAFGFEYKKENVEASIERLDIDYPVLMDNNFRTWEKYETFLWPTQYLIDHNGKIVYEHLGEGNYRELEEKIRFYLSEANPMVRFPSLITPKEQRNVFDEFFCGMMSEEISVGTGGKGYRLNSPVIANEEGFKRGRVVDYVDKGERRPRGFFVHGSWQNGEDYFEHAKPTQEMTDYIGITFEGHEVYATLNTHRLDPVKFYVLLDSKPIPILNRGQDILVDIDGNTYVLVDEPRLYYLVRGLDPGLHEMKLYSKDEAASISNFSFGNQCLTEFEKL